MQYSTGKEGPIQPILKSRLDLLKWFNKTVRLVLFQSVLPIFNIADTKMSKKDTASHLPEKTDEKYGYFQRRFSQGYFGRYQ